MKTRQHTNNFDFVRVFAASLVLFSHQFALLGRPDPSSVGRMTFGSLGVCIFFSISGFLVSQSWMRDPHPGRFLARRLLRIWPALFVVTVLSAFVLGPMTSTFPIGEYLGSKQTWNYFKTLVFNNKYELPGVFEKNPFPNVVNGSLWTIPFEIKWYLVVLVAGVLGLMRWRYLAFAAAFVFAVFCFAIHDIETNPDRKYLWEYGLFFLSGACLNLFRAVVSDERIWPFACLAAAAGAIWLLGHPLLGLCLFLPYAVVRFGTASTPVLRRFGRFGDLSYGLYIYAFPVQQLVVWLTDAGLDTSTSLMLSAGGTLCLASLSWHFVEKPAMKFRPKRRDELPL